MIDKLKTKNGLVYNDIQYRVWAETIDAGRHDSFSDPPKGSFFKSQGRKGTCTTSQATPPKSALSTETVLTPIKISQLRSTYIQQIKELHSLLELGAIDNDHFTKQRDVLLQQMDKLNS